MDSSWYLIPADQSAAERNTSGQENQHVGEASVC